MTSNPSLRDLYSPPSASWAFVPPNMPSSKPSAPGAAPANASGPSYQFNARSASSAVFDLNSAESPNMPFLLRSLVASALLQYSSTALAMPLEVGKLLLQIQWVPRDALAGPPEAEEQAEEEEYSSDGADEDEAYFIEPGAGPSKYPPPKPVDDTGPPLWLPVVSHIITGFILSPLDLVRTRLIAQSSMPRYKTYRGPVYALSDIIAHEGGIRGVYFHPHLFIPTILDTGLRAFTHVVLPSLIAPHLGLGPHVAADTHPVAWPFAEVLAGCLGLLITLPIETVRRRLQVQTRGTSKPLRTCVETRPVPYNGVVDVLWHILTEERSDLPIKRPRRPKKVTQEKRPEDTADVEDTEEQPHDSWLRHTGIGQLYRGLGMRLAANTVVFALASLGGGEETDGGWAEL
ncbi:hypothetical protein ID866_1371 [Astraeus odoratus]|nr:hypothetical protein ID866_1371 [Astraeus odoratus]